MRTRPPPTYHTFGHPFPRTLFCCQDSSASLALDPDDPYSILTKPHGHGDVHALMHSSGTARSWKEEGCEWVVFMQVCRGFITGSSLATEAEKARHVGKQGAQ